MDPMLVCHVEMSRMLQPFGRWGELHAPSSPLCRSRNILCRWGGQPLPVRLYESDRDKQMLNVRDCANGLPFLVLHILKLI